MSIRDRPAAGWLLLTFTIPAKRASQRVGIWRKLQRYGTVPLGNSGYLLPSDSSNEERFHWLAKMVRKYGGEASVARVESIDNLSTAQLKGRFSEARAREYQELIEEIKALSGTEDGRVSSGRLTRLGNRFQEIVEVDFFDSPLQVRVRELLEQASTSRTAKPGRAKISPKDYKNRVWVTRPRPGVDRCASAWLIRGFIDAKAQFAFAPEDRVPTGTVPFDMFREDGFGHHGEDCTFETLEREFRIRDRRVGVIGQMIHDADLLDDRFGRKEGYGVDAILKGWARRGLADSEILERGIQLIEGLYYSLK
ncbi:MAG TPA: chromate resistance protein ChrB domain-containing protein [Candidatus Acidoferrum sp.]|jgi:hypothetical protein|nr:chromate resistance protein ChrB domain-containing protein [Candidatus Acidoferrum sp.]